MKRIVTGALALALLFCLNSAAASNAGSSSDPFVTKTYAADTFAAAVRGEAAGKINDRLGAVHTAALKKLQDKFNAYKTALTGSGDYLFAAKYEQYDMPAGSSLTGITGTSVVMVSGSLSLTVLKGAVVDVDTGEEVSSGTALRPGVRYFCAEDTEALFTASAAASCNVNGQYKPSSNATKAFTVYADVGPDDWYYKEAQYVYKNALYYDYAKDTFRQAEAPSRAMFVYAIWKQSGSPTPLNAVTFKDLSEDWYKAAVAWASENKIVEGYSSAAFGPNDKITREQIATMMYRYARYMNRDLSSAADLSGYTDAAKISDWALEQMKWANVHGIITGMTKTELAPQGTATRAQVAAILMRFAG